MLTILIPVITLCVLGLCFGIGLSFLSKRFTVHVDERIEKILALLPGANCGACGQPGCAGFAQALLDKSADLGRCVVCDKVIKQKIAEILGVELSEDKEQRSAFNACGGGSQAIDKFIYYGIYDCLAAAMVLGGQKSCSWACLGFCSCQEVCPVCAIDIIDRVAVINPDICIGCGKCMEICPKKTIDMVPKGKAYIRCCSQDKGAEVNKVCRVGCIACQKCVKVCPVKCISMENNLARIDHKKCIACGKCVEVCPKKCIEGNFKRETIDHRLKQ